MRCDLVNIKLKSYTIKERQNGGQQKASPTGRGGTAKAVTERGRCCTFGANDTRLRLDDIHTFGVM
jgi:hypothetical protein